MEAMSSCKIIAIKTRKPWDENQELIGQGLAKIAGAFSQTIPVSGSFSRSALNLSVQAQTGLSSIFSALFVLLALLFFTPLLHHLPKPVLAAIIITALANLIDFGSIVKAWRARRDDGVAAVVTFIATLAFAPGIQTGILCGIALSVALLLYRMMRPRAVVVGMHADGTLRDAAYFQLDAPHPKMRVLRFDRSLFFVNASYFEDAVITLARDHPELRYILVAGGGINEIDASGIEVLGNLSTRLKAGGITLGLSGIKRQVMSVMTQTGLTGHIGAENIFVTDRLALDTLCTRLNTESTTDR
jgi:SulP family sulfate permease